MADGNITVEVSTQAAQAELERLRAENARLAREAHAWWTAARDAAVAERERCAQRVALHSQYPIQTDYDRGYDKARKDAAETLRNMSTYVSTYAPDRPSTPVGWSDTDWLKHLDEIRQNNLPEPAATAAHRPTALPAASPAHQAR